MAFSHQKDPDNARIVREAELELRSVSRRLDSVEDRLAAADTFETYVRDELYPWLVGLETFVAYGTPPPEPPP